jgi:hypothetical protein
MNVSTNGGLENKLSGADIGNHIILKNYETNYDTQPPSKRLSYKVSGYIVKITPKTIKLSKEFNTAGNANAGINYRKGIRGAGDRTYKLVSFSEFEILNDEEKK